MNRISRGLTIGLLLMPLMCAARSGAQEDHGYWRMASTNAKAVTGDIDIAELKVTIDFLTFPIAQIRRLKPVEVSAVFDADVSAGIEGTLYRLNISRPSGSCIKTHSAAEKPRNGWQPTRLAKR